MVRVYIYIFLVITKEKKLFHLKALYFSQKLVEAVLKVNAE